MTRRRSLAAAALVAALVSITGTALAGVISREEAILLGVGAVFALALAFLDARARRDAGRIGSEIRQTEQRIGRQLDDERSAVRHEVERLTRTIDRDISEVRAHAGRAVDLVDEIGRELGELRDVQATVRGLHGDLKEHDDELARRLRMLEERSERRSDLTYRMIEAIVGLNNVMPGVALHPTRGWAASPDLLIFLYRLVVTLRPRSVVECGSGVSSLVIAHALESVGVGKLVSLEHDDEFRDTTVRSLAAHGLDQRADVVHAPLQKYEIDGADYNWYALPELDAPIDLLFIDGPPKRTGPQARYPAVPLLKGSLSAEAVIVLDDTIRADEAEALDRWKKELPNHEVAYLKHEKGTGVLAPSGLRPQPRHLG